MPARIEIKEGECEACHIFIGGKEEFYLEEYKEHTICLHCQFEWQVREELAGRKITWREFTTGRLKKV